MSPNSYLGPFSKEEILEKSQGLFLLEHYGDLIYHLSAILNHPHVHVQVYFLLYIKADFDGPVSSLELEPLCSFEIDVKESGGQEERKGVVIDDSEEHELSGSRGTAHFAMKWSRDSKHFSTINLERRMANVFDPHRGVTKDDHGKFVPVVGFECRGLEPIAWYPRDEFRVLGESGAVWDSVDLSEKEWFDYDEKSGESVGITDIEYEFRVYKK